MKKFLLSGYGLVVMICLMLIVSARAAEPVTPPSVGQIISNVLARAEVLKAQTNEYNFRLSLVVEDLNAKGDVRKRTIKEYEVIQCAGVPLRRLVSINGKPLTAAQQKKEDEKDQRDRQRARGRSAGKDEEHFTLTKDLSLRFDYAVLGQDVIDGRAAWRIKFHSKGDSQPTRNMGDRVMNHLVGEFWVDVADNEISRARVYLTEKVSLLGGIAGNLERFDFSLDRARAANGVWYNSKDTVDMAGRKLFTPLRVRAEEEALTPMRAETAHAATP